MHILHRDTYGTIGIRGDTRVNDPLVGLGIASGLSSGVFGFLGQKDTNNKNLQIARETNAQNYKIWQEQQAHNKEMFNLQNEASIDMWNMQNAYNDPSAQVERLLNAGLNPALMMGSNPSGVASSPPTTGTAQPAQSPTMVAPSVTSPFQTAFATAMQGLMTTVEAFSTAMKTPADIANVNASTQSIIASTDKTKFETSLAKKFEPWDVKLRQNQAMLSDIDLRYREQTYIDMHNLNVANKTYLDLQADHQAILNEFLPGEKQLNMIRTGVEIAGLWLDNRMKELDIENYFTRYLMVNIAQADLLKSQKTGQDVQNKKDQAEFDASGLADPENVKIVAKHMAEAVKWRAFISRYTGEIDATKVIHIRDDRRNYPKEYREADTYKHAADSYGVPTTNGFSWTIGANGASASYSGTHLKRW